MYSVTYNIQFEESDKKVIYNWIKWFSDVPLGVFLLVIIRTSMYLMFNTRWWWVCRFFFLNYSVAPHILVRLCESDIYHNCVQVHFSPLHSAFLVRLHRKKMREKILKSIGKRLSTVSQWTEIIKLKRSLVRKSLFYGCCWNENAVKMIACVVSRKCVFGWKKDH